MVPWLAFYQQSTIYCHPNMMSLITKDINHSWYKKVFKQEQKSLIKAYPKVINTSNFTFQPIETLGHTYDHVCLYEQNEGWLFTGDLYVTPHPKVSLQGESITEYIDAIESLLQLNFTKVFCGHQGAVNHGREMLKEKLNYLKETKFKVKQLHDLGYSDQEIVKELFPGRVNLEIFTFGSFSRINFVRSCYQERV
ncbi:MBL fold metallo-hydrolase [Piscibacillus salipiscarius]|nr:MBL fold metallo-hydrolase [Piscibacillus salipiscarius]